MFSADIQQVLSFWILNESLNTRDRKMALQKLILGCAVWKLHIWRCNFQSLGNINCIFNPDINWKVTQGLFLFFYFTRLTLWREECLMAIYEWGYSILYPLWTSSTFDSKEERSNLESSSQALWIFVALPLCDLAQVTASHPFTFSSKYWGGRS